MKFYNVKHFIPDSEDDLKHSANRKHAAYGTKNSVSDDRGTDGKKNNTSEYNHEYYEENTDKWLKAGEKSNNGSKKRINRKRNKKVEADDPNKKSDNDALYYDKDGNPRFGHKDYDPNDPDFQRTDGKAINGTDLKVFTNANGSTIILGKGIKFSFPPGTKITSAMERKLAQIEGGNDGKNKEQYVAKMLNAVTGFASKQNLFPDEKKSKKEKSEKTSNKSAGSTKSEKKLRSVSEAYSDNKKKKSSAKHSDDIGSIFIRDLF